MVGLKVLSYGDLCMPPSPPSPIWAFILMVSSSPFGIDYGGKTIVVVMLLMHSRVSGRFVVNRHHLWVVLIWLVPLESSVSQL